MKNKLKIVLANVAIAASVLTLASCGKKQSSIEWDPNNNSIGYQWKDLSKPILDNPNNDISFNIISSKDPLAIEYNDMHNPERQKEAEERGVRRSATQADWDAFLG